MVSVSIYRLINQLAPTQYDKLFASQKKNQAYKKGKPWTKCHSYEKISGKYISKVFSKQSKEQTKVYSVQKWLLKQCSLNINRIINRTRR